MITFKCMWIGNQLAITDVYCDGYHIFFNERGMIKLKDSSVYEDVIKHKDEKGTLILSNLIKNTEETFIYRNFNIEEDGSLTWNLFDNEIHSKYLN